MYGNRRTHQAVDTALPITFCQHFARPAIALAIYSFKVKLIHS